MLRKNFFIRQDQLDFLEKLPGNVSEHIRIAIDDYIKTKIPLAKQSPSRKVH